MRREKPAPSRPWPPRANQPLETPARHEHKRRAGGVPLRAPARSSPMREPFTSAHTFIPGTDSFLCRSPPSSRLRGDSPRRFPVHFPRSRPFRMFRFTHGGVIIDTLVGFVYRTEGNQTLFVPHKALGAQTDHFVYVPPVLPRPCHNHLPKSTRLTLVMATRHLPPCSLSRHSDLRYSLHPTSRKTSRELLGDPDQQMGIPLAGHA